MIRVVDLQKSYDGKRVLGPVGFEVARGETVGVLGRNGAGKTTLLRILAGDLRPSDGAVWIDGIDVVSQTHEARSRIGYLPETPPVYEDMRVGDFLAFAGRLRGMTPQDLATRLPEVERITQVDNVHHKLIRHLSYGYRQRVGVAQAIIHDPPVLILDEPTHDLDPVQIVEMRTLIQSLKGRHTVILSSHILPEIRETCDRLLVIASGDIVASGSEDELTGRLLGVRRMRVSVRPGGATEPASTVWRASAAGPSAAPGSEESAAPDSGESAAPGGEESAVPVGGEGAAPVTGRPAGANGGPEERGVLACVRGVPGVREVAVAGRDNGALTFTVTTAGDCRAQVCRALVLGGHDVLALERAERELENVFLELVGEARHGRG